MDPLRLAIAFVPISAYLLLLAVINLRRRPLLTTGANDFGVLAVAVTGLVFVGPIELLRPEPATDHLGSYVWLLLLGLYWLLVSLVALVSRPSLSIYNVTLEELRPAVAEAVSQIDAQARWAGDCLVLPQLGVQLHLESYPWMRHASLMSSGNMQDLEGWHRLKKALARSLSTITVRQNPRWASFLFFAVLMFVMAVTGLLSSPERVAQDFADLISL